MSITPLPALSRDSVTFKSDVDTFFDTLLPTMTTEMNEEISRINDIGVGSYSASSSTSMTIGTGTKSFVATSGKAFVPGQTVSIASTSGPTDRMVGVVTAYNPSAGNMVVDVSAGEGSGTFTAWSIGISVTSSGGGSSEPTFDRVYLATSTTTWTVPDGVTQIRAYAVGKGGNGVGAVNGGGGGGGGMAFGTIAVAPEASVAINITSGIASVVKDGTTLLTANPGADAVTTIGGGGGTATKHASVADGGAYTGGTGGGIGDGTTGGGASAASPIGNGVNGSTVYAGGAGIGGAGAINGGGGGGAGGAGATGVYGGGGGGAGGAANGQQGGPGRSITALFSDPLLRHATGRGGDANYFHQTSAYPVCSHGGPGGGGAGLTSGYATTSKAGDGGDFGGGGAARISASANAIAGKGGFLGGGGSALVQSAGMYAYGGNGGYGGGGGGAYGNAGGTGGTGGAACVVILY